MTTLEIPCKEVTTVKQLKEYIDLVYSISPEAILDGEMILHGIVPAEYNTTGKDMLEINYEY